MEATVSANPAATIAAGCPTAPKTRPNAAIADAETRRDDEQGAAFDALDDRDRQRRAQRVPGEDHGGVAERLDDVVALVVQHDGGERAGAVVPDGLEHLEDPQHGGAAGVAATGGRGPRSARTASSKRATTRSASVRRPRAASQRGDSGRRPRRTRRCRSRPGSGPGRGAA
ncbi:hypothetical protein GCM10009678_82240 [Actinomadura kijaniata]